MAAPTPRPAALCVRQVNQLCRVFLGVPGWRLWELCVIAWVYVCLWLYLAIMAQTLLVSIPLPGPCGGDGAAGPSGSCPLRPRDWEAGLVPCLMCRVPRE